jgi:DNA repair exonuclease SbcCD ATPase subunit
VNADTSAPIKISCEDILVERVSTDPFFLEVLKVFGIPPNQVAESLEKIFSRLREAAENAAKLEKRDFFSRIIGFLRNDSNKAISELAQAQAEGMESLANLSLLILWLNRELQQQQTRIEETGQKTKENTEEILNHEKLISERLEKYDDIIKLFNTYTDQIEAKIERCRQLIAHANETIERADNFLRSADERERRLCAVIYQKINDVQNSLKEELEKDARRNEAYRKAIENNYINLKNRIADRDKEFRAQLNTLNKDFDERFTRINKKFIWAVSLAMGWLLALSLLIVFTR